MENKNAVLIVLGSAQDEKYLTKCIELLKNFEISYKVKVASAHRSPERLFSILKDEVEIKVILAFAGHAAHLGGVIAAHVNIPVIAIPLPTSDLLGLDSLLAVVQMPAGVPVASMAIGEAGSQNAAVFAAQILAVSDIKLSKRLIDYKKELVKKVEKSSIEVEKKWQ